MPKKKRFEKAVLEPILNQKFTFKDCYYFLGGSVYIDALSNKKTIKYTAFGGEIIERETTSFEIDKIHNVFELINKNNTFIFLEYERCSKKKDVNIKRFTRNYLLFDKDS